MSVPPDPQPNRSTGLEAGGGVPPGETPPESGSTTEGLAFREPAAPKVLPVASVVAIILGAVILVALAVLAALDIIGVI